MKPVNAPPDTRTAIAAEVVELGAALFDTLLEIVEHPSAQPDISVEDLRAASDTFIATVRALLGLPDDSNPPSSN